MLTKKEYAQITAIKEEIEIAAKALLDKIAELNLTPATNLEQLKQEYKSLLFSKLLTVDKGLKLQYEIHRTDTAKLDLINRTISLDGYENVVELENLLTAFTPYFNNYTFKRLSITAEDFITKYNGLIETAFTGKVIDVTETELYKEFKALADKLNDLYQRGIIDKYAFSKGFYMYLDAFIPANGNNRTVEVNETEIYYYLRRKQ